MIEVSRYVLALIVAEVHLWPLGASWTGHVAVFAFYTLSGYLMTRVAWLVHNGAIRADLYSAAHAHSASVVCEPPDWRSFVATRRVLGLAMACQTSVASAGVQVFSRPSPNPSIRGVTNMTWLFPRERPSEREWFALCMERTEGVEPSSFTGR